MNDKARDQMNQRLLTKLGWTGLRWNPLQPYEFWGIPPGVKDAGEFNENVEHCPDFFGSTGASLQRVPDDFMIAQMPLVIEGKRRFDAEIWQRDERADHYRLPYFEGNGDTRAEALAAALEAYIDAGGLQR